MKSCLKDYNKTMKAKNGLIIKQLEDEYILIDSKIEEPIFNGMIKLNETSKFIMDQLINKDMTMDELMDAMMDEYEVSKDELKKSVPSIINDLKKVHIIKD